MIYWLNFRTHGEILVNLGTEKKKSGYVLFRVVQLKEQACNALAEPWCIHVSVVQQCLAS